MKSLAEKRFQVAVEEAKRINAMLAKGYIGRWADGKLIERPFVITDTEVKESLGSNCWNIWHLFDENLDNGSWTPISTIRALFRQIDFFAPVNVSASITRNSIKNDLKDVKNIPTENLTSEVEQEIKREIDWLSSQLAERGN